MKRQLLLVVSLAAVFSVFTPFFVSGPGSAEAQAVCSDRTLKGAYGNAFFSFFQLDPSQPGMSGYVPVSGVGRTEFDGQGSLAGTTTNNFNGQPLPTTPFTGNYTVAPDCTGTMVTTFPDGFTVNLAFVIVDGGKRLQATGTDTTGVVVFSEFVRQ